jgi:hypothetical protein
MYGNNFVMDVTLERDILEFFYKNKWLFLFGLV